MINSTRARLLRIPDLTLEAAINSCRASEASKRQMKELSETNENSLEEVRVKHAKRKKQSTHGWPFNECIIDDILVCGKTTQEHDNRLREVL